MNVILTCFLPRRFIKGFIYRHNERCPENEYFLDYVRYSFLMKLHRNLPKNVLDKSWPTPPAALTEVTGSSKVSVRCFIGEMKLSEADSKYLDLWLIPLCG